MSWTMRSPLRVAMVAACPFPWGRGTPIRILGLADALARRGHDVHVATYHLGDDRPGLRFAVHRIRDVPAYHHTAPGPTLGKLIVLDPMLGRLLGQLQCELRPDIVHAHHYEGLAIAASVRGRAPIVYDAHTTLAGELPHYWRGLPGPLKRRIGAYMDRRLPRLADQVIAVSRSIRDALVDNGSVRPSRLQVIPNGVDAQHFEVDRSVARDGRTVIFTGNLARYQRLDLLIEAFGLLHARRPDARLMIVTHSSFAPYEALARQFGVRNAVELRRVPFAEEPALLAAAAVAVNPRTGCDGIPQKLLNYMAARAPIVSFDGSARHLEHERTGLRVHDGDTAAMAAAIERLLDDPVFAQRLGGAARDRVSRDFSWDGVAARTERVYRRAIDDAACRPRSTSRAAKPRPRTLTRPVERSSSMR